MPFVGIAHVVEDNLLHVYLLTAFLLIRYGAYRQSQRKDECCEQLQSVVFYAVIYFHAVPLGSRDCHYECKSKQNNLNGKPFAHIVCTQRANLLRILTLGTEVADAGDGKGREEKD